MYQIILAGLGQDAPDFVVVDREEITADRLAYNLKWFWVWNIRGSGGFEADGPCVFLNYGPKLDDWREPPLPDVSFF